MICGKAESQVFPECNVGVVCNSSGGVFQHEGKKAELYLNKKINLLTLQSEKILKKPHKDFVLEGQQEERIWIGQDLKVTESSKVISQSCVEMNKNTRRYEESQTGCGVTDEVILKIESRGKSSLVKGTRYNGA